MENKGYNSEEIEPFCKWRKEKQQNVLEVHLRGFKKDQLKVQINNLGVLTISGARSSDANRQVRFRKQVTVSKDCKRDAIRAKFSGGVLHITMPKTIIPSVATQTQPTPALQRPSIHQDTLTHDKTDAAATKCLFGLKCLVPKVEMSRKMALKLGALAAVVLAVALGTYIAYKYNRVVFHAEE